MTDKKTVDEFAGFFDEWADAYDEENDEEVVRRSAALVVEHASPRSDDRVVDLGTGTGAIALALAEDAGRIVGRDISGGMLEQARTKATERGVENVEFGVGRFRAPNVETADVVVSNFAMHHLGDEGKREAIEAISSLEPIKIVTGHCMFFGETDPEDPVYSEENIYPSTVGHLVNVLTDEGFAVTAVEKIHDHVGVLVAEHQDSNPSVSR